MLAFTPNNEATDGFDWGYDGGTPLEWPDDLNWLIDEDRCVIQGVGAFDYTKTYPFWLNLSNEGECSISLTALENFEEDINVFIHDSLDDTYTLINSSPVTLNLSPGLYSERYYIAFQIPAEKLDTESPPETPEVDIVYMRDVKRLKISQNHDSVLQSVELFNTLGQLVLSESLGNQSSYEISVPFVNQEVLLIKINTTDGQIIKRILI